MTLIETLSKQLAEEGIDYCHWKSTAALDRSASGENDLDLLIRRRDSQRFVRILCGLGFKEARAPRAEELPGLSSYYGLDETSGRLVHVHAHYQLVLGHDRTKNYRLPIEEPLLASCTRSGPFPIPAPEFEFLLLVIRMVLKHFTWDASLGGQARLPESVRREWAHLRPKADVERISGILGRHLPCLDEALFRECTEALEARRTARERARLARRLERALSANARRPAGVDLPLRVWRRVVRGLRRRLVGRPPRKRLARGGAMIAFVGGDGSGKSTAVDALCAWLSSDLEVRKVHLGKPPWSWTTTVVRGGLTAALHARRLMTGARRRWPGDGADVSIPAAARVLRRACISRDRRRAYVKARRFANEGGLVICDRFPLPEIRLMDGPLPDATAGDPPPGRVVRWLVRLDQAQYLPIAPPEVLIVLRVDPEIAVRRKVEERPDSVRARSREIWDCDWRATPAHVIDASRSSEEVLATAKSIVWSAL